MPNERPNILLIMSDQHHAGIMGCAGDPIAHTPALDRLASQGVRFTNAYCSFPLCGPSRMSFMTCRHPYELQLWDNEAEFSSDIPTFAHALLASGYDTVLSGRMHFCGWDQRHGFAQRILGDVPASVYISAGWQLADVLGDLVDTPGMSLAGITKSGPGRTGYQAYDESVTRATTEWLQKRGQAGSATPFLLTVGYAAPHCPYVAPPEDFEHYANLIGYDNLPPPPGELHPLNARHRRQFQVDPAPPLDAQWRTRVAYYGLCTFLDRQVAAVLASLASAGLADNTIVIYTSDHGEMLGEHGLWWKSTLYDGAARVPLLVAWPGCTEGGLSVSQNVSLMDIGVTLLDLCEADPLPGASGRSLRCLLSGEDASWDDTVYAEYAERGSNVAARMVRSGPWKYNYYQGQRPELFNLQQDPGEINDLWQDSDYGEVCRELEKAALNHWDPGEVARRANRRTQELPLLAHWVRTAQPPEPDPVWYDAPLENWVDMTRRKKE
jgi:choline-sulfatase